MSSLIQKPVPSCERPCCAFCPSLAVDTVDLDGERGVPVCAVCGGLRVGRGLASPAAPARPRITRAAPVRVSREGTGRPHATSVSLSGRGRR